MNFRKEYYKLNAKRVIEGLESRNMEGYYCKTREEANRKVHSLIKDNSSIAFGGSMTLNEIGLIEELKSKNHTIYDRSEAKTNEDIEDIYLKAFSSDYYLMSTNAITLDGELINIDGRGNRVAALIYGPKNVIIVAGMNKLVLDETMGMKRVRNESAPINTMRLDCKTPCNKTGYCHDCKSDACICCQIVTTRFSRVKNRIKVVLVGEELGY